MGHVLTPFNRAHVYSDAQQQVLYPSSANQGNVVAYNASKQNTNKPILDMPSQANYVDYLKTVLIKAGGSQKIKTKDGGKYELTLVPSAQKPEYLSINGYKASGIYLHAQISFDTNISAFASVKENSRKVRQCNLALSNIDEVLTDLSATLPPINDKGQPVAVAYKPGPLPPVQSALIDQINRELGIYPAETVARAKPQYGFTSTRLAKLFRPTQDALVYLDVPLRNEQQSYNV